MGQKAMTDQFVFTLIPFMARPLCISFFFSWKVLDEENIYAVCEVRVSNMKFTFCGFGNWDKRNEGSRKLNVGTK